jgi:thiosulfate dehydrogenase [quinone] large subunit
MLRLEIKGGSMAVSTYAHAWKALAVTRITLGFVFLWAFLDKTFGWGFATPANGAWVNGGSPTTGFLAHNVNTDSPFASLFSNMAGQNWVDWLFMLGLLGIGLALVLGIGLRAAAVAGTALLVMMWAALIPLENNPLVDDHLVYALVLWVVAFGRREWSLTEWWLSHKSVKKNQWLW